MLVMVAASEAVANLLYWMHRVWVGRDYTGVFCDLCQVSQCTGYRYQSGIVIYREMLITVRKAMQWQEDART